MRSGAGNARSSAQNAARISERHGRFASASATHTAASCGSRRSIGLGMSSSSVISASILDDRSAPLLAERHERGHQDIQRPQAAADAELFEALAERRTQEPREALGGDALLVREQHHREPL